MSISDIICKHLKARSNCLSPECHRKPAPSVPPALKFKRPEPVDTCEHGILRKNCEVPECHPELQKKPSPVTDMMAVRNQVVRCQDAIENYPWKDAEGTKLDGCRMFSIMMRYARHAFAPAQQVFLSSMEVNMARWTLYRYQQAAVSARLLQETGKRTRKNIPLFVISESVLKEWAEKDPIEKEIEQRFRELSRKPIDPEDAAEEAAQFAADELQNDYDRVEDVPFDPAPGESLHTELGRCIPGGPGKLNTYTVSSWEMQDTPESNPDMTENMPPELAAALRQHLPSNGTSAFKY